MLATSRLRWLLLAAAPYPFLLLHGKPDAPHAIYARDVQPVMKAHCLSCHTEFATPEGLLKDVKPGDAAHSELIRRIRGLDGKSAMPKGFPPLPAGTITSLENWIDQGARTEAPKALFARDVQPLLKAHCASCHGGASPAGDLDLTDPSRRLRRSSRAIPSTVRSFASSGSTASPACRWASPLFLRPRHRPCATGSPRARGSMAARRPTGPTSRLSNLPSRR